MRILIGVLSFLILSSSAFAQQQKYWVVFKKKEIKEHENTALVSEKTLENRKSQEIPLIQYSDFPVSASNLESVKQEGAAPLVVSKWLNAASAKLTPEQVNRLKQLPNVKKVIPIRGKMLPAKYTMPSPSYATAISQMEANVMAEEGLTGEGVVVGVIDAGFFGAKNNKYLKELFKDKRVLGVKDLVNPLKTDHYDSMETFSDSHGTTVLKMITGVKGKGEQSGFATNATFYLARTDHGDNETRGEEDNWVQAMEWMDSLGVRLINTSLGYALGFDDPNENYKLEDMDGQTSIISKAAQIASDEKGILLVVSAGNEGSDPAWRIVSTPADAKGVLSIGATDPSGLKMGYSSIGPEELPYLKPNVSCFSLSGTSFSAPVITGFAACLLQKKPEAKNTEIIKVIEKSAQLYPYGNNFIGYGIPKASMALSLLKNEIELTDLPQKVSAEGKDVYTVKVKDKKITKGIIFHKKDERIVLLQNYVKGNKGKFEIKKAKDAQFSSVIIDGRVYEIAW
ncbi:S8 family serine peptidase [Flammeovirgaceae bacterium SG7u.111]|nr:S8 family serine peptidase [Flammeovirgaceae bacterium SG7u.132]WPO35380.1 S8 family serine peptidase [Flammeovirgaceae bacterium SG7u.111]